MMAELRKTTMGYITHEHLKQSRIVVPKLDLIKKLDIKIQAFHYKVILLQQENQELGKLRDWLLSLLVNKQIKVK